jgi:hypothetical protein
MESGRYGANKLYDWQANDKRLIESEAKMDAIVAFCDNRQLLVARKMV